MDGKETNTTEPTNPTETQVKDGAGTVPAKKEESGGGIDFGKLDEILEKRMGGVIKSVLKANGVEDENELADIVSAYRESKKQKTDGANEELERLRKENEGYRQKERQSKIDSVVNATAKTLGIDLDALAMTKCDISEAVDKDGKVDTDKVKKVLEDLVGKAPWLKKEVGKPGDGTENRGGFRPTNPIDNEKSPEDEINRLRKLAGLGPKKN